MGQRVLFCLAKLRCFETMWIKTMWIMDMAQSFRVISPPWQETHAVDGSRGLTSWQLGSRKIEEGVRIRYSPQGHTLQGHTSNDPLT